MVPLCSATMRAAIAKPRPVPRPLVEKMGKQELVQTGEVSELLSGKEMLGGAVGIELKATLKARKLLVPLNAKNAKNIIFAEVRYTPGTPGLETSGF